MAAAGIKFGGYESKAAQLAAIAAGKTGNYKKDTQNILSKPAVVNDWQNMTDGYAAGSPINYSGMDNSDSGWANSVADNLRNTQLNSRLASQNYLQDGYETEAYGSLGKNAFYSQKNPWGGGADPDPNADKKGWFNKDNMSAFASGAAGLGSLASGWAALKNLKLTRQALENQQNQWQSDYDSQRLVTNNQIANQNAWKQAQGRTDYGSYVGGKPAGTNYVG